MSATSSAASASPTAPAPRCGRATTCPPSGADGGVAHRTPGPGVLGCRRLPGSSIMGYWRVGPAAAAGRDPMGHYRSNLRDLEFTLFELLGRDRVLGSGPYEDVDGDTAPEML